MIRRPPRSTLFPTRRSSDLSGSLDTSWADMCRMLAIVSQKPAPVDTLMAFRALADTGRNFRDFGDRKSTRLNSSHLVISYAVFCLKKKTDNEYSTRGMM